MRVLVTGGAGFIGSHVVQALLAERHEVRVLDALLPSVHTSEPVVPEGVELRVGDVRDAGTVAASLHGIDAVSHQAAAVGLGVDLDDLPHYVGMNDLGTAVLLAQMNLADVGALVLASSMVVYGEGRYDCPAHGPVAPGPRQAEALAAGDFEPPCPICGAALVAGLVTEDARLDPRNVYAATKVAQEHLASAWARESGGSVAALRYHNVYGAGMPRDTPYAGVGSLFRSALSRGQAPRVFEDGGQRRDFVEVRDVAAANVAALQTVAHGGAEPPGGLRAGALRAYNVGSGEPHTIGELAGQLAAALGGPDPVVTGQFRLGDVRHVTASSRRLREELGWAPTMTFADGVAAFASAPLRG